MLKIVVGNKKYSSWSLRAWLVLKHAGVPFEEIMVALDMPETAPSIRKYSPSGRVPALIDGDVTVWDSLAISEYLQEKLPEKRLWPKDAAQRARARSVAAEMHSGFANLRNDCSMKIVQQYPQKALRPETQADADRIVAIWEECLKQSGGPFLFGKEPCIADAFYAPVASRFRTYSISVSGAATPSGPGPRCRPGWPTRSARRSGRSSTRTDAVRRLHPLPVLPLEVPLLRFRLARGGGDPAAALHRRGPARASRASGAVSPSRGRLHLLWRRNALLVGPAPTRQGPWGDPRPLARPPRCRGDAGSQPGDHRRGAIHGVPRAGRQPALHRRAVVRPRTARRAGAQAHRSRRRARLPDRARRRIPQCFPGPHPRRRAADAGAGGPRRGVRGGARTRAHLLLRPDPDRARRGSAHGESAATRGADAARRRGGLRHGRCGALGAGQGRLWPVRDQQLRPARARGRPQLALLARRGVRRGRLRRVRLLARGRRRPEIRERPFAGAVHGARGAQRNRRVIVRTRLARGAPARADVHWPAAGRRNRPRCPGARSRPSRPRPVLLADPAHRERRAGLVRRRRAALERSRPRSAQRSLAALLLSQGATSSSCDCAWSTACANSANAGYWAGRTRCCGMDSDSSITSLPVSSRALQR